MSEARKVIESLVKSESLTESRTVDLDVEIDGEETGAVVEYGFEPVGEGDAGFDGRPGVAVWIESIKLADGTDVTDKFSPEQLEELASRVHATVF